MSLLITCALSANEPCDSIDDCQALCLDRQYSPTQGKKHPYMCVKGVNAQPAADWIIKTCGKVPFSVAEFVKDPKAKEIYMATMETCLHRGLLAFCHDKELKHFGCPLYKTRGELMEEFDRSCPKEFPAVNRTELIGSLEGCGLTSGGYF